MEDRIEQVDIVIPRESFGVESDKAGVYTLSTLVRMESSTDRSFRLVENSRHIVYYEATGWPEVPCEEYYPSSEWTAVEKRMFRDTKYRGTIPIYPAEKRDSYETGQKIEADPGEEISINLSVFHFGASGKPGGALVPFFGAEQAGEMWLYKDGVAYEDGGGRIAYRRQFVVEAPTEPGIHRLYVAQWPAAYRPAVDYWGDRLSNEEVIPTAPGRSSNVIPIEVTEE